MTKQERAKHLYPRLEDIAETLKKKSARLVITIADSCNVSVPKELMDRIAAGMSPDKLKAMFQDFKGSILITAASKTTSGINEVAFYEDTPDGIGKFTRQFVRVFDTNPDPSQNIKDEGFGSGR